MVKEREKRREGVEDTERERERVNGKVCRREKNIRRKKKCFICFWSEAQALVPTFGSRIWAL
jgi:hypothetical protein